MTQRLMQKYLGVGESIYGHRPEVRTATKEVHGEVARMKGPAPLSAERKRATVSTAAASRPARLHSRLAFSAPTITGSPRSMSAGCGSTRALTRRTPSRVRAWRAPCKCNHGHDKHDPVTLKCTECANCRVFTPNYVCIGCDGRGDPPARP